MDKVDHEEKECPATSARVRCRACGLSEPYANVSSFKRDHPETCVRSCDRWMDIQKAYPHGERPAFKLLRTAQIKAWKRAKGYLSGE